MTSTDLMTLLAAKYAAPYFVFLPQLRDATGFDATNTADAVALGLYRSRGRDLHGFEVKVSRSDWLRELKKPEKAERIAQYCDFWWIVVSEPEIAQIAELPAAWGLMVAFNGKLKVVRTAARIPALPLSRELLCSIVKKTFDLQHKPAEKELEAIRQQEYKRGVAEGERRGASGRDKEKLDQLTERIEQFEKASGIQLTGFWEWQAEEVGRAVREVVCLLRGEDGFLDDRNYLLDQAETIIKDYKDGLEFLKAWKARTVQRVEKVS